MNVVEFRAKLLAIEVPLSDEPFTEHYVETVADILADLDNITRPD